MPCWSSRSDRLFYSTVLNRGVPLDIKDCGFYGLPSIGCKTPIYFPLQDGFNIMNGKRKHRLKKNALQKKKKEFLVPTSFWEL